ncbi:MFS transporter [Cellulomonas sp. JH27-2]|uniref:MFS transporter n=1 Tax=Cellulomonas sp. JH27-2 TaxID=2774139 RepID=UPI001782705A|nr:MFS transporter [Cellulomonas sp. JH27-2]
MTGAPAESSRRARLATSLAFTAQGFVLLLLLLSLDSFKTRYGVDDDLITVAVAGVLLAAAAGTFVADAISRRGGSWVALVTGLTLIGVAVPLAASAPTFGLVIGAFAIYGLALGMVDASQNMQAVAVQRAYGRPLTAGFYAAWSVGAVVASFVVSAGIALDLRLEPVHVVFLLATPVTWVSAVLVARCGLRTQDAPLEPTGDHPRNHVPWRPMLVLAVAVVAYFAVDNATQTWGTIYLLDALDAADWVAPLVIAPYLAATLVSRLVGDSLVRRWGRVRVVRVASLIGAAGLLLVVLAHGVVAATVGFSVAGAGLGLIVPLCFSAAGALSPDHADAVIARLNVFNYLGTLLGAVMVGAIGSATSFRIGFLIPVALVLVVAVLAGRFATPAARPESTTPQEVSA